MLDIRIFYIHRQAKLVILEENDMYGQIACNERSIFIQVHKVARVCQGVLVLVFGLVGAISEAFNIKVIQNFLVIAVVKL